MVFTKPPAASKIGRLGIYVYTDIDPNDPTGATVLQPSGSFELQLLDSNLNVVRAASGNLAPQLTAAQQQQVQNLMQALRTKAQTEAL